MARIIIVEDESIIADDLTMMLEREGHEIIGPFDEGESALDVIQNDSIHLALLDINIKGSMTGVDIARVIRNNHSLPFIFLTSYYDNQTLKQVEEVNPEAYIVKPFRKEEVLLNVKLALKKNQKNLQVSNRISKLLVRDAGILKPIDPEQITFVKAESNYTKIKMSNEKEYVLSHTMKIIEEKLPESIFCRVHKSFIINFNFIELIEGNSLQVANQSIPIGRSYREILFQKLEVL